MSLTVEGEKCPVCHGYMFDDEDIVFCPVCGQPHHRECYNALGECASARYHGTDMQYRKPERPQTQEQTEQPQPQVDFDEQEEVENNRFGGFEGNGATFITNIDPYGGVSPNKVDTQTNITAKEYKKCVVFNTARYIPKFFGIQKGSRSSWNWASAIFPHAWYFYRKCYGQGVLAFVLRLVGVALSSFGSIQLFKHLGIDYAAAAGYAQIMANSTQITNAIMTDTASLINFLIAAAGMVIVLATHIISGIFGDAIYKKECVRKIDSLKQIEDDAEREAKTRRAYGINIYYGLAALMLFQIAADLILFGI